MNLRRLQLLDRTADTGVMQRPGFESVVETRTLPPVEALDRGPKATDGFKCKTIQARCRAPKTERLWLSVLAAGFENEKDLAKMMNGRAIFRGYRPGRSRPPG
jgi:hypothetical protein